MMAILELSDTRFPRQQAGCGEAQLGDRLGDRFTVATQLHVLLTQPAVADLFINPRLPGGGLETAPVLDRGQEPDAGRG